MDIKEYPPEVLNNNPTSFVLTETVPVTHNTILFKFAIPNNQALNLPIGKHIKVSANIGEEVVSRNYTPITPPSTKGHFDLLIKVYEKGKISKHIHNLKIGDTVEVKGPTGLFDYKPNKWSKIGMIAGGTGITPLLQVIRAILEDPQENTQITLLFSNSSEEDILLKDVLDEMSSKYKEQFRVYYTISKLQDEKLEWKGFKGRITPTMLEETMPSPATGDVKILYCGPLEFNKAVTQMLNDLKYTKDMIYKF